MNKLRRIIREEARKVIARRTLKEASLAQAEQLASSIQNSIVKIDDSMDYQTLAQAVAIVLEQHYGQHNLQDFLSEVKHFFNYRSIKAENLKRRIK